MTSEVFVNIVGTCIAVLVAIAIPVFTSQLEKSRESTDLSNVRSAYAEITAAILDDSLNKTNTTHKITGNKTATFEDNTTTYTVTVENFPIKQTVEGWATTGAEVAGVGISDTKGKPTADSCTLIFTWTRATDGEYLSNVEFE